MSADSLHQSCTHIFAPNALSESGEPVTGRVCTLCGAREASRHQVGQRGAFARELFEKYADQIVREAGTEEQYKQDEEQFLETVEYLLRKHSL